MLVVSTPAGYETAVLQDNPIAFYTLNENIDPSTGTAPAFDVLGNYTGTYVGNVQNGYDGIVGPQATIDGLPGFPDNNLAFANSPGGGSAYA